MWLLVVLLCAACSRAAAAGSLQLVYAITRHGARNALAKTELLQEPTGGVTLLPTGQRQCYDAGAAFRARYLSDASCGAGSAGAPNGTCLTAGGGAPGSGLYGVVGAANVTWSNVNVRVVSSALDRTLLSARSFLEGVFPPLNTPTPSAYLPSGAQPVPVYSAAGEDADDVFIRTYTKCPSYQAALERWYDSPEFVAREAASAPLRSYVASLPNVTLDTSLRAWWNVYDAFNVWRSAGVGDPMPSVNASVWSDMVALANWLETSKMASALTGQLLGGPIVADVVKRMLNIAANAPAERLVVLSAHYNSQLGVLSALNMDGLPAAQAAAVPWLTRMPSTAAVLAFELYQGGIGNGTSGYGVRLVAQDGPAANYTVLPLPCASALGASIAGEGACMLREFVMFTLPGVATAGVPASWCNACNNVIAAPCVVAASVKVTTALVRHHRTERVVDVAVGVGIGLGVPLAALAARLVWLRVRRRRASVAAGHPGDISLPAATAVWPHHRLDES